MKKFLVVLLALAMILAIASTAMAADTKIPDYNDTKTSTEYANDIYRLTALGVLEGNTGWGGAYRPADNLTRAEFAKIACFMFGKQSQVNYYKAQPSAFSDVEEGFWAEGWINCANDNGLMIGIGGGKFAPQANVTKQEVATVVLRAVGYTDELPGAWPADYIAKSQKVIAPFASETLFDYVEIIDGTAATRAEMAAIVNYALDLYRVAPAGNQLIVNGISDADADGYLYKALKTNEVDIYNFFLGVDIKDAKIEIPIMGEDGPKLTLTVDPNLTTRETLLWDVFHAFEIPYLFESWTSGYGNLDKVRYSAEAEYGYMIDQYVEASGWGYEDLDKGELVFLDDITRSATEHEAGLLIPVASDYYIFDDCLDGELWQVGGRLANLTVQVDVSKINIRKLTGGLAKGVEAVYAEMLSDVNYIDEETEIKNVITEKKTKVDNADVFSLDLDGFLGANLNGNYAVYDYDWFAEDDIAIVKKVASDLVTVDNTYFGEKGEFCTLGDDCKKKHEQNYVFLKDGKLQDATCLKVDDVLYFAGYLAEDEIELYIVYTPKAATLDEMSKGAGRDNYHLIMSGDEFWFCGNGDAHEVSYDGGYAGKAKQYDAIVYDDLKKQMQDDDACLFAPGYGKKYVATIIFAAGESNVKYGVLTDVTATHNPPKHEPYWAKAATIFGVNGEDVEPTYDLSQKLNVGFDDSYAGDKYLGFLGNFELNNKDQIKIADKSLDADSVLVDPAKSGIGVPNGDDTGFVPFDPQDEAITVKTNGDGVLSKASFDKIDTQNTAITGDWGDYMPLSKASMKDMTITEDTVIFEVTAKSETEGDTTTWSFDSVKLGDPNDYIDAEFSANQISIFAWDGTDITVLYVVNPAFHGDILFGLFEVVHSNKTGDFVRYEDEIDLYFNEDIDPTEIDKLTDHDLVYALYKTKNDEIFKVYAGAEDAPAKDAVKAGDFVALVVANGFALNGDPATTPILSDDTAKALLKEYTDGADYVSDVCTIDDEFAGSEGFQKHLKDFTEYIDMTGDGGTFGKSDLHDTDDKYAYIFVVDEFNDILKVFRVQGPKYDDDTTPSYPFIDIWDIIDDIFD